MFVFDNQAARGRFTPNGNASKALFSTGEPSKTLLDK